VLQFHCVSKLIHFGRKLNRAALVIKKPQVVELGRKQYGLAVRLTLDMRLLVFVLLLAFLSTGALAQNYSVSGRVTDADNGEDLIGALIKIKEGGGAITNTYGFYSVSMPAGTYTFTFIYLGYNEKTVVLEVKENMTFDLELVKKSTSLGEVTVTAESQDQLVENKKISVVTLEMETLKEIPVVFGEVDVLKTITLLPGIQSGGEASSGFNVRGGGQDQNLILLDEATVYNASHLLGFFSVFNGDAIKDFEVYKGGIPAKYGGRLSSLVDIRMKDGNRKHFSGTGGLGTISSRLTLEGPIVKDKSSFMVAGRRSYADVFLPLADNDLAKESTLYFYDLNLKANYILSDKDRLYLSGYFGRDVFGLGSLFGLKWGNATATLRWNHLFSQKLFSNISFVYSDFDYGVNIEFAENAKLSFEQDIQDVYIKPDFTYFIHSNSTLNFGGQFILHHFNPGTFTTLDNVSQLPERDAFEGAIYVDHQYKINNRFNVRYGLRYSSFAIFGGTNYTYQKDENYQPIDSLTVAKTYGGLEAHTYYGGFEPRISASFSLNSKTALKGSFNRTYQYIQQASNTASSFPTDQWFSSNNNVKPQIADQVALGWFRNFDLGLETSVEAYYKWMQNQIDYREGAVLGFNEYLDGELLLGDGRAYGLEFFINKTKGNTTGFLSYTLSRSERKIEGVNQFEYYVAGFDRTHNLSLVLSQKLGPRVVLTGSFVYNTGNPFTPPSGKYWYRGKWNNYYGSRNSYRIPDYHRADVSLTIKPRPNRESKFSSSWNFSVYNVYNRENPYSIYFGQATEEQAEKFGVAEGESIAVQVALFKIIPSITWNFTF
jgi:hypothetical protein